MNILSIVISVFVLFFSITVHEASHGWAAYKLGDPTAYAMGRVTLNPLAHIDLIGTILLPAIFILMKVPPFGWAKPVPVNPLNLKDPRRDNLFISAAGPLSNLCVAFIAFLGIIILKSFNPQIFILKEGTSNIVIGLFLLLYNAVLINIILAFFNLIPLPPLDGSGVLMGLLSGESARKYEKITPYGFIIILLLLMTGILGRIFGFIMGIINFFIF